MTEAQIQLQNALTTTFLANLAFLSEYDNELYHRVDELSRMIENGSYKEKYALEFIMENGDFDIYDIVNDKYLYNKSPKKINDDLVRKVQFDEKNAIFNIEEVFCVNIKPDIDFENRFNYENSMEFSSFVVNNMFEFSHCLNNFLKNKNKKLKEINKFIFLGTLLGRHIPRVAEKIDASIYLVLERNLEIFRLSLFTVDYTILAKKGVVFSIMDDNLKEEKKISLFLNISSLDNYLVKFSTTSINIEKYIDNILVSLMSMKPMYYSYSRRIYSYINRTTKVIESGFKVLMFKEIKKKFDFLEQVPILYIAAGPSLDENIEWVKENQNKFFIVTIGAALKKLLDNNIRIDMITTLDEQYDVLYDKQFSDENIFRISENTIILASTITNEKVLKKFNQNNLFLYEIYNSFFKDSLAFNGYSVGEVTVDLLLKMNVKEIYLLGLDLALNQKTGESHAKDSNSGVSKIDLNEIELRDIFQSRNSKIKVKGNLEEEVFTTSVFYNSIKYLEKILSKNTADDAIRIFNLSVHGAYFEGSISQKIDDINLEKLLNINIQNSNLIDSLKNNSRISLDSASKKLLQKDIEIVRAYLQKDFSDMKNMKFGTYKEFLERILQSENKYRMSNIYWILNNYSKILLPYLSYSFNNIKIKKEEKKINKIKEIFFEQMEVTMNDYISCLERINKK